MAEAPRTRRGRRLHALCWCLLGLGVEAALLSLFACSDACELPPPFEAMDMVGEPKSYYEVGEKIEYKCKKGYIYLFPLLTVTTCEPNHTWVPISDEGCWKIQCEYLKDPPNGKLQHLDGGVEWGSRIQYSCFDGYYLIGKEIISCVLKDDDVYWTDKAPRCEKIFCTPPPKIQNGNHTFTDIKVFNYKEAVTYMCDPAPGPEPFTLIGKKLLYCSGHNTWSSPPPECKVVKCPFPVLENGRQVSGFAKKYVYEATVMLECDQGYYMNGSDTVVCSANSTWKPEIPLCLKGPKPTHPPKPPVYNYPDAWIIALIVITSIVGVIVVCLLLYRCLQRKKQGTRVTEIHGHFHLCIWILGIELDYGAIFQVYMETTGRC
uniref:membrane cofactor protein isoform X2 n=1 Tax=Jaculus jaculus TaxID=51337 RepID=UPI001E1B2CA6|nr:membrane cofactor protein isoform X2 [Jaculus jaculus]